MLALAAVGAATVGASAARAKDLKEVRFSEAVHNLGYINLYVGMHAGIFEKNGLKMNVTAAGGDTQTFAAVLGGSADFAIGDATMVQMSREAGGPGVVVGTVVQRAHYFGVSKNLEPITDPKQFKGLTIVTSPEPNTNYSVAKRMLEKAGLKIGHGRHDPAGQPGHRDRRHAGGPGGHGDRLPAERRLGGGRRGPRWCSTSRTMSARSATPASWSCPRPSSAIPRWSRRW